MECWPALLDLLRYIVAASVIAGLIARMDEKPITDAMHCFVIIELDACKIHFYCYSAA